ncbi:uncharacterized protein NESG_01849 [Nematocida ausubeli]|uniref:Uncharacterized protein n=1 Tax=Nematocida ausubeli (strain ATCC PRA-371 / ERTm2) TaxID=1913371 RepID=A0A086J143_NEMA1|nr:uncharacterized protein NESG_01849 [Nematocida ausubeli]KFG25861.1 hypothetical protein NESG_01849 [Nematocida ausubeli]
MCKLFFSTVKNISLDRYKYTKSYSSSTKQAQGASTYAVLSIMLFTLLCVRAIITPDIISDMRDYKVNNLKEGPFRINPYGALNMMHGYVYTKMGLMHNKRFFSPEISINYRMSFILEDDKQKIKNIIQEYGKDTVHETYSMSEYSKEYHSALIKLFPSCDGYLTIETSKEDSFFMFINSAAARPHAHKILASLLLLSEGIDVPIKLEKTKDRIVLSLQKANQNMVHFNIAMHGPDPSLKYADVGHHKGYWEAMEVIEFFIKSKNNPVHKKKGYTLPKTYKEFKTGKFLDSTEFLIQSYIYECITTREELCLFAQTVHDLLWEHIETSSVPKRLLNKKHISAVNLFYSYFTDSEDTKCDRTLLFTLLSADNLNNREITFSLELESSSHTIEKPKFHMREIKSIKVISANLRDLYISDRTFVTIDFSGIQSTAKFINCVETSLLFMFCAFTYNYNTQMYMPENIPHVSENLKKFFSKYRRVFQRVTRSMHDEWNKVVADLDNEDIYYRRTNLNHVDNGLLNILCVISEIAGIYSEEKEKIDEIRELILNEGAMLSHDILGLVSTCIASMMNKIFHNRRPCEVDVIYLKKLKVSDRIELIGEIRIRCCLSPDESVDIYLNSKQNDTNVKLVPLRNSEIYHNNHIQYCLIMKHQIKRPQSFIAFLLESYLDYTETIHLLETSGMEVYDIASKALKEEKGEVLSMNRFFLSRKIFGDVYKSHIIYYFFIKAIEMDLPKDSCIVRFVSNVLGTGSFKTSLLKKDIFRLLFSFKNNIDYFPNVFIDFNNVSFDAFFHPSILQILKHLAHIDAPEIIYNVLCRHLEMCNSNEIESISYLFWIADMESAKYILWHLTKKGSDASYIDSLVKNIKSLSKSNSQNVLDTAINTLLISIITITCTDVIEFDYIIKKCCDLLILYTDRYFPIRIKPEYALIRHSMNTLIEIKSDLKDNRRHIKKLKKNMSAVIERYKSTLSEYTIEEASRNSLFNAYYLPGSV